VNCVIYSTAAETRNIRYNWIGGRSRHGQISPYVQLRFQNERTLRMQVVLQCTTPILK
jgi:hypothetical protein